MRSALVLLLLLFSTSLLAQDAVDPDAKATPRLQVQDARPVDSDLLELRALDAERQALMRDLRVARAVAIEEALADNRQKVDALGERLADAILPSERLAIEREIERAKFDADVQLMSIQADFARRAGLDEVAVQMDAQVEAMRERWDEQVRTQAPVQE